MDDLTLARALHVSAVVLWIGGVGMVTLAVLPGGDGRDARELLADFDRVERRFAPQARIWTLIAGVSGFYMLYVMDAWDRYLQLAYWWVHAMTAIWVLFSLVLFIFEPWFLHSWFQRRAALEPEATWRPIPTDRNLH